MEPPPSGARITVVVADGEGDGRVVARLQGLRPDLDLLDGLARLRLAAAKVGLDLRYCEPCPTLRAVIEMAGLDEVLLDDRG